SSPVYNRTTDECEITCEPWSDEECEGVVCTALDQCHDPGGCSRGLCDDPWKRDGTPCDDGNSCTVEDTCTFGECTRGNPIPACCGNGTVDAGEECDDGNQAGNPQDGCAADCTVDDSWLCSGTPSSCCMEASAFQSAQFSIDQSGDSCQEVADGSVWGW